MSSKAATPTGRLCSASRSASGLDELLAGLYNVQGWTPSTMGSVDFHTSSLPSEETLR